MLCPDPYHNHQIDKKTKEPIPAKAATFRPSEHHMSGSTSAQNLCGDCAEVYDQKIVKRQADNRSQRHKDVLHGKITKNRGQRAQNASLER